MTSLETAVARMFCVGFVGTAVTPELRDLVRRGVSTIIFFSRNVQSPEQFADLAADLKELAGRPLLTSIDQEGGRVMRIRHPLTEIPSMRALGLVDDVDLTRELGRVLARELRAVNIDIDYAPAVDVDTNPANPVIADRSFGPDVELVKRHGIAMIQGLQGEGVAACAKHFPGHGDTHTDSHLMLPRLPHDMERLNRVELPPFKAAIDAGVAMVMTAHVMYEPLDPKYPATMSVRLMKEIIRDRFNFDGVVIADDLEMKAIADHYGAEEAVIQGANASVDLFPVCHTPAVQNGAIDALIRAVESGRVPRARIEEANRRLDALAAKYAKPPRRGPLPAYVGGPEHRAVVDRARSRLEKSALAVGKDPTEIMDLITGVKKG